MLLNIWEATVETVLQIIEWYVSLHLDKKMIDLNPPIGVDCAASIHCLDLDRDQLDMPTQQEVLGARYNAQHMLKTDTRKT